ncbi:hypothetical protein KAI60_03985 [Candidatus Bathyarchaeota archaeon]|nr:hypothetical protein [Candidatus Bathyarchaeota archaeon]MCK5625498.1 hypothetical protein [Candidatus Bathyarchaeota archaeon]
MTDKLKASERVEKKFVYIFALTKECRKALTAKFKREHNGLPFDSLESVMRREVESWFTIRDRHIELNHDESKVGKPGELFITYLGSTKEMRFKIHIKGLFTLAGSSSKSPAYLKSLNLNIDKREFNKK